jgi:hypothetical protein
MADDGDGCASVPFDQIMHTGQYASLDVCERLAARGAAGRVALPALMVRRVLRTALEDFRST